MDLTEIEWKKIRSCDICEETGFVREINDNEGNVLVEICFYGCMDSRNIPTPDNSVGVFFCKNKGTEEVHKNEAEMDIERMIDEFLADEKNRDSLKNIVDTPEIYSSHSVKKINGNNKRNNNK